ncbi:MAG: hypothetical protein M1838_002888 [Thelocarpon superellum]|nr:MAG: hypothetical protein M1838_002888 [Thelocarpon superellum]
MTVKKLQDGSDADLDLSYVVHDVFRDKDVVKVTRPGTTRESSVAPNSALHPHHLGPSLGGDRREGRHHHSGLVKVQPLNGPSLGREADGGLREQAKRPLPSREPESRAGSPPGIYDAVETDEEAVHRLPGRSGPRKRPRSHLKLTTPTAAPTRAVARTTSHGTPVNGRKLSTQSLSTSASAWLHTPVRGPEVKRVDSSLPNGPSGPEKPDELNEPDGNGRKRANSGGHEPPIPKKARLAPTSSNASKTPQTGFHDQEDDSSPGTAAGVAPTAQADVNGLDPSGRAISTFPVVSDLPPGSNATFSGPSSRPSLRQKLVTKKSGVAKDATRQAEKVQTVLTLRRDIKGKGKANDPSSPAQAVKTSTPISISSSAEDSELSSASMASNKAQAVPPPAESEIVSTMKLQDMEPPADMESAPVDEPRDDTIANKAGEPDPSGTGPQSTEVRTSSKASLNAASRSVSRSPARYLSDSSSDSVSESGTASGAEEEDPLPGPLSRSATPVESRSRSGSSSPSTSGLEEDVSVTKGSGESNAESDDVDTSEDLSVGSSPPLTNQVAEESAGGILQRLDPTSSTHTLPASKNIMPSARSRPARPSRPPRFPSLSTLKSATPSLNSTGAISVKKLATERSSQLTPVSLATPTPKRRLSPPKSGTSAGETSDDDDDDNDDNDSNSSDDDDDDDDDDADDSDENERKHGNIVTKAKKGRFAGYLAGLLNANPIRHNGV